MHNQEKDVKTWMTCDCASLNSVLNICTIFHNVYRTKDKSVYEEALSTNLSHTFVEEEECWYLLEYELKSSQGGIPVGQ